MSQREFDTLERCIESLEKGLPLDECIKGQMDISPRTIEIAKIAERVMVFGQNQVTPEAVGRSRVKILSQAAAINNGKWVINSQAGGRRPFQKAGNFLNGIRTMSPAAGRLFLVLGITMIILLFSSGLVVTSAKSLPGEALYPVKRAVEELEFYIATRSENPHEYEQSFNLVRVDEVQQLLKLQKIQQVSFEGVVENTDGERWTVSGIPVLIQAGTNFVKGSTGVDAFAPGAIVEVEGSTRIDGVVAADEIHLSEYLLTGIVERIEAKSWTVSGVEFAITMKTKVDAGLGLGDRVTVEVHSWDQGLIALSINKVEAGSTQLHTPPLPSDQSTNSGEAEEDEVRGTPIAPAATSEIPEGSDSGGSGEVSETPEPHETEDQESHTIEPSPTGEQEHTTVSPESHETPEPTGSH